MITVAQTAELAWGYTMADIDRLTRQVVRTSRNGYALDTSDQWDYAWHAIVLELYREDRDERPTERELIRAGFNAHRAAVDDNLHHHGTSRGGYANTGAATGPKFARYWAPIAGPTTDDFTERIAERLALPQVLATLTPREYEAISTLAIYGTNAAAAAALGVSRDVFKNHLNSGRRRILAHWLAPETVPAPWDNSKTCKWGHPWDQEGVLVLGKDGKKKCRICSRMRDRLQRARQGEAGKARERSRHASAGGEIGG